MFYCFVKYIIKRSITNSFSKSLKQTQAVTKKKYMLSYFWIKEIKNLNWELWTNIASCNKNIDLAKMKSVHLLVKREK